MPNVLLQYSYREGVAVLFIKTTKAKNYEYIKLVESYWKDGKSKHRVLYNFGRTDLIKKDASFLKVVKKLCEIAELSSKSDDATSTCQRSKKPAIAGFSGHNLFQVVGYELLPKTEFDISFCDSLSSDIINEDEPPTESLHF